MPAKQLILNLASALTKSYNIPRSRVKWRYRVDYIVPKKKNENEKN